jgi:hypothetical protein
MQTSDRTKSNVSKSKKLQNHSWASNELFWLLEKMRNSCFPRFFVSTSESKKKLKEHPLSIAIDSAINEHFEQQDYKKYRELLALKSDISMQMVFKILLLLSMQKKGWVFGYVDNGQLLYRFNENDFLKQLDKDIHKRHLSLVTRTEGAEE